MSYTAKAFNTADGQKTLNDMAQRNGRDLDGTAIIASVSEINNLFSNGYITKTTRPLSGPLRYSICPVIKDPRDGGIAPDQFLAITRKPNRTALEPEFLKNFESLRLTGETGELIEHSGRSPQKRERPLLGFWERLFHICASRNNRHICANTFRFLFENVEGSSPARARYRQALFARCGCEVPERL